MAFHAVGSCGTNWTCAHRSKMGSSWCNTGSCRSRLGHGWLLGHGFVGLLGHGWLLGHRLCLAGSSRYTYAHTSKSSKRVIFSIFPSFRTLSGARHREAERFHQLQQRCHVAVGSYFAVIPASNVPSGWQSPYGTGILRELMLTWKTAITCMCM